MVLGAGFPKMALNKPTVVTDKGETQRSSNKLRPADYAVGVRSRGIDGAIRIYGKIERMRIPSQCHFLAGIQDAYAMAIVRCFPRTMPCVGAVPAGY